MFFAIPSIANTNKLAGFFSRDYATYICPSEKHDTLKSKPKMDIVWPWDLLIVIPNVNVIGNWRCLKWTGTSVDTIGIRGNNIFSPSNLPFKMMPSITFFINILMINCVLLHNRGGFKLRSKITGDPTFSFKLYGGMPSKSNEFRNSVG